MWAHSAPTLRINARNLEHLLLHSAAIGEGMGVGPGHCVWCQGGRRGLGPPRETRRVLEISRCACTNATRLGSSSLRCCPGMNCCAIGAVVVWVLMAGHPGSAGLVGHLLLRRVRCESVGRGHGVVSFRTSSQAGGYYIATGSVGGLGGTQMQG